jgi:hypothetical protein
MFMRIAMAVAVIFLASCGSSAARPSVNTSGTGSNTTVASPGASSARQGTSPGSSHVYAVFVKDFFLGQNGYEVLFVKADGSVASSAHGRNRSFKNNGLVDLPVVSSTHSRVYYLDGDADVRYLQPDGGTGLVERLPVANHQIAAFAVDPDNRRLAFSVLDYNAKPITMRLFTEDLGGANRTEIFSSNSVYEWPVGWHHGGLVLAVSPLAYVQNAGDWFMGSRGFHVVEPATANRLVTICETVDADSAYPTSPWGAACLAYPKEYSVVSWEGQKRELLPGDPCRGQGAIVISPDGSEVAVLGSARICAGAANDPIRVITAAGTVSKPAGAVGTPLGWIDADHLVFQEDLPPFSPANALAPIKIADLGSGAVSVVATSGFFAGTVPGGL